MRIRTMAGIAVTGAAAAAAIAGGVAYATADDTTGEPTLKIVTEQRQAAQEQPSERDCPDKGTEGTEGTGL